MKGQVACEVAAACELGRSGWRPQSGELMVIVTCDEEAGATIGAKWLCEEVPEKVRCDMIVNEGAGEVLDFDGRRFYTVVVGEKGVFRFKLTTEGRAGHASMPAIGDNALLRMVEVLARLDGRQPPYDDYPAGTAPLEALVGDAGGGPEAAIARIREIEPRLAEPARSDAPRDDRPDDDPRVRQGERDSLALHGAGRLPRAARPRRRPRPHAASKQLLGSEQDGGYRLEFTDDIIGNSSPLGGPLAQALRDFAERTDPGAELLPIVFRASRTAIGSAKRFRNASHMGSFHSARCRSSRPRL